MGLNVTVQIISAANVNGVFPFVVVCFDNDLENEVYKTSATFGGSLAVWNESFPLDLTVHMKKVVDSGKPEPTYLTFFMFDTGVEGIPTLGSAGVLLSTVSEKGVARGDFPVINGTGTLSLVVEVDQQKWYKTNTAKYAAGAVGVGAVAAGLTALAINNKKKKKGNSTRQVVEEDSADEKKKKKFSLSESVRAIADRVGVTGDRNDDDDDDSDDDDDENPQDIRNGRSNVEGGPPKSRARSIGNTTVTGPAPAAASSSTGGRKWWDPETDEDEHDDDDDDDDDDDENGLNIGRHNDHFEDDIHDDDDKLDDDDDLHTGNARHDLRYVQAAHTKDYAQPHNSSRRYEGTVRNDGHQYQEDFPAPAGVRGSSNVSGARGHMDDGADYLRASDQPGEFGGTTYIQDDYQNADLAARLDA